MLNALREVTSETVVITDAARPLATADMARRALDQIERCDGAVVAVQVSDTLKRVEGGVIVETRDRSGLYRAQTPQAFRTSALLYAHERAAAEGFEPTDDAVLLERYGGSVAVVEGSEANIKVTYERDLVIAEALLAAR